LEEFAVSESDPAADSTSPMVTGIVPLLVFRTNVWAAIAEMEGASFTALTVSVKALLLLDAPSLTVRVMTLDPLWSVAGSKVTVRFEPVPPPSEIFVRGIRVRLDDLTETTRFDPGVSRSVTVNPMGPVEVSSLTDRGAMVEIAGGALM
jgi:hypothetical protein